jgi:hypothetical protein
VAAPGDVLTDVSVYLRSVGPRADEDRAIEEDLPRDVRTTPPDDGWFAFGVERDEGLPPGLYEVSASSWRNGRPEAAARVEVTDGPATVEVHLPRVDRTRGVFLRVTDPTGGAVVPDEVYVDARDAEGGGGGGRATFHPQPDGSIWIPTRLPRFSGKDPVEIQLWILKDPYGLRDVEARAESPPTTPIEVRFEPPAALRLRVHGAAALPSPSVQLVAARPGIVRVLAQSSIGPDGAADFEGLQPGERRIDLRWKTGEWYVGLPLGTLRVHSGEQEATRDVPPLFRGRIHGVSVGSLTLHRLDRDGHLVAMWMDMNEAAGRRTSSVDAPPLPEGDFEVRSGGSPLGTFRLPSSPEVTLAERPR